MDGDPSARYEELRIEESLRRSYQYPIVCKELSLILRGGYSKFPKNLQAVVFQDTITAFRLLPQMQTETAGSAANNLVQSAEAVLPKQKKILAVKEFKHAKITFKRQNKDQKGEACAQLSEDILVHIFSFLDLRSLLSAASVCWVWNSASSDNHLWYLLHEIYFARSGNCSKDVETSSCRTVEKEECAQAQEQEQASQSITNWKNTFKTAYESSSSKELISYRGYCWNCRAVVWLKNTKCWNETCTQKSLTSKKQLIKPICPDQVVDYILHGTQSSMFCLCGGGGSSSDSDWDEDYVTYMHQHWIEWEL